MNKQNEMPSRAVLHTLTTCGLNEKEAKIYLTLLSLGKAKIREIAHAAGLNRSSSYITIESLKQKGLVSIAGRVNKQEFVAASPETLLRIADEHVKEKESVRNNIKKILPDLTKIPEHTDDAPRVYIFSGEKALEVGYGSHDSLLLEQKSRGLKEYRVYEDLSNIHDLLPSSYTANDSRFLNQTGLAVRIISPDTAASRKTIAEYKKHKANIEFKVVPESVFNKNAKSMPSFSIYHDKIEFLTKNQTLVVIESKEIADVLKNIYDQAWHSTRSKEKINKTNTGSK